MFRRQEPCGLCGRLALASRALPIESRGVLCGDCADAWTMLFRAVGRDRSAWLSNTAAPDGGLCHGSRNENYSGSAAAGEPLFVRLTEGRYESGPDRMTATT